MKNDSVETLSADQSWKLLATSVFGRLVLCIDGKPEIFPINVRAGERSLLFHTVDGTKLAALTTGAPVAFETDAFAGRRGWSVVAKGRSRVLTDEDEIAAARASGLRAWVPTEKTTYVRLDVAEITGRRFAFGLERSPA